MATESIMKPGTPEAKVPLRRSTIIAIGVVVFVLMILGAALQQSRSQKQAPVQESKVTAVVGTAKAIDAEAESVEPAPPPKVDLKPVRENNSTAIERNVKPNPSQDKLSADGTMSKLLVVDTTRSGRGALSGLGQVDRSAAPSSGDRVRQGSSSPQPLVQANGSSGPESESLADHLRGVRETALSMNAANSPTAQTDSSWLKQIEALPSATGNKAKSIKEKLVLAQGMVIPAALTRAINSDLPGEVTARTTVDVYDSFDGFQLLIPAGSTLYGVYNSSVNVGQERIFFVFTRLILPNRIAFDLKAAKGMDLAGGSGLAGDVNNHFFKRFGSSLLVSLLAMGAEKGQPAPGFGSPGGARTAAGEALVDVSRSILERNKTIAPTLEVPVGTRINVQVNQDMLFPFAYTGGKS